MAKLLVATVLLLGLSTTFASCPNDCSGHGACNTYSACECMRNWMGADCSERMCMYSRSFVDTPQGDLNADGFVDVGTAKTVILGSTQSFFDCGTATTPACVCTSPGCIKFEAAAAGATAKTKFESHVGATEVTAATTTGATDSHASTTLTTADNKASVITVGDLVVTECGSTKVYRQVSAKSGVTITISPGTDVIPACKAGGNGRFNSKPVKFYTGATMATTPLVAPVYPGDEFTTENDPYQYVAACNFDNTNDLTITHAIKVEVPAAASGAAFPDMPDGAYDPIQMAVSEFYAVGEDHTGATGLTVNTKSDIKICAISGTTYKTQWSPNKEWERYPDEAGAGYRLGRNTNTETGWYDEAHFFKECSGKGSCDRSTGECTCYPGWEGTGCVRASCPNACSGHGQCVRIADVVDTYLGWDNYNSQYCVCESGYEGADCSLRTCPKGHDPIHRGKVDEIQTITIKGYVDPTGADSDDYKFQGPNLWGTDNYASAASMALVFTDEFGDEWTTKSFLIKPAQAKAGEQAVLQYYATHSGATVTVINPGSGYTPGTNTDHIINLGDCTGTFTTTINEAGQVTGVVRSSTITSCNPATGGLAVKPPKTKQALGAENIKAALEALPNNVIPSVTVTASIVTATPSVDAAFAITFTHNSGDIATLGVRFGSMTIRGTKEGAALTNGVGQAWWHKAGSNTAIARWNCQEGGGGVWKFGPAASDSCNDATHPNGQYGYVDDTITHTETTKGNKLNRVCSDRGICDYNTGQCKCFAGHTDVDCSQQNALSMG